MPKRAVVFLQPGSVPQTRQITDCLAYCNLRAYKIVAVCPSPCPADAVRMVVDGEADLVVTAFSCRHRPGDLREVAVAAGVTVECVRPAAVRVELGQLAAGMLRRGGDLELIARLLGETTKDLRAALSRLGIKRTDAPPSSREQGGRRHDGL